MHIFPVYADSAVLFQKKQVESVELFIDRGFGKPAFFRDLGRGCEIALRVGGQFEERGKDGQRAGSRKSAQEPYDLISL